MSRVSFLAVIEVFYDAIVLINDQPSLNWETALTSATLSSCTIIFDAISVVTIHLTGILVRPNFTGCLALNECLVLLVSLCVGSLVL